MFYIYKCLIIQRCLKLQAGHGLTACKFLIFYREIPSFGGGKKPINNGLLGVNYWPDFSA